MVDFLYAGQGKVGGDVVGAGPYTFQLDPFRVGVGYIGDSGLGSTLLNPRTFVGPGIVVGSPLGFVGDGKVGATDSKSAGLVYRPLQRNKDRLGNTSLFTTEITQPHVLWAFFPLDDSGRGSVRDLSSLIPGGVKPTSFPYTDQWITGKRGPAALFTHASTTQITDASNVGSTVSISCWIRIPDGVLPISTDFNIFSYAATNNPATHHLTLGVTNNGTLQPYIEVAAPLAVPSVNNRVLCPAIPQGVWTHIVFSWKSAYTFTVNGVDQTTQVVTGNNDGKGIPEVGSSIGGDDTAGPAVTALNRTDFSGGQIAVSDFGVWTRTLTQDEKSLLAFTPDAMYDEGAREWLWIEDLLKSQISASVSGVTSLTAAIQGSGALAASASGTASLTATLRGAGALNGSASGVATLTATLRGAGALNGAAAGTASLTATIGAQGALVASASGTATLTATLRGAGALNGSASGVATLTATLRGAGALNGAAAGTASLTATIGAQGALVASASGTATLTATLRGAGALNGSASGVATLTATLRGAGALNGAATGTASLTASLQGLLFAHADIFGSASLTAHLIGLVQIIAHITGSASLTANLHGEIFAPLENKDVVLADADAAVALVLADVVAALVLADVGAILADANTSATLADANADVFNRSTDQLVTI